MGRYYHGDVDGKFWFAVQSSSVPERFGAISYEPNYTEYGFEELQPIKEELEVIVKELGNKLDLFNEFFDNNNSYNDEMLLDMFKENNIKLTDKELRHYLSEYADYCFGEKIRVYMEDNENSGCYIQAEH